MKKRVISLVIMAVIAVGLIPGQETSAMAKRQLSTGDVVSVNKTEEEFEINVTKEGKYTLYSDVALNSTSKVKMSVFDANYNIIGSNTKNFDVTLKPGKYFVKIENTAGMPLKCSFAVTKNLEFNKLEKVDSNYNTVMFKLNKKGQTWESRYALIDSCENKDVNEDTKITIYDANLKEVLSNDDMSDECKYSKVAMMGKVIADLESGNDFYVKMESKDKGPLSAGMILTEDNQRHEAYTEFISPEKGGYYLMDEELTLKAYCNYNGSKVELEYSGMESYERLKTVSFGEMKKDAKSNTFKATIKPQRKNHLYAFKSGNKYTSPKFVAKSYNQYNQATKAEVEGYITYYGRVSYEYMDSSWYYNSPFDHSFKGYGTDGYNCMAYGLGITDQWIWPWGQGSGISFEGVSRFFKNTERDGYAFTECSEEPMANAQVLYYEGHVAVVTEWDSKGMPTKIVSKWGGNELIESTVEGLKRWGKPLVYMKGRIDK